MPPDFKGLKVKYFREFDIPLAGLSLGNHTFGFEIGPTFFQQLDYAAFQDGDLKVVLNLTKQETLFELNFETAGHVVVSCARCLDEFNFPVIGNSRLIIKYGEAYAEESDEVLILPHEQHHFDVSHLVYEYISLLVPFRCTHPEDEDGNSKCNPEMISRLEQYHTPTEVDPRWEALKNLKKE